MWDFLFQTHQFPFTAAMLLVLLIGLTQVIGLLAGVDLFSILEDVLPVGDGGMDGVESVGFFHAVFGWLELRKVPLLVSIVIFLSAFGAVGLALQQILQGSIGYSLHSLVAVPVVALAAVFPTRLGNRVVARIFPRETTYAVSSETFIGLVATITIGTATYERAAEARLKGPLGRTHYIMVYADIEGASFAQGEQVLLVGRRGSEFTAIQPDNPNF